MSILVEQRPDAPSKVQSGSLDLVYKLRFIKDPSDVFLEPIIKQLKVSKPVSVVDFQPSNEQLSSYRHQSVLHMMTIEEASSQGNLGVTHNTYIEQIKRSEESLEQDAIPCICDQLTNNRIRHIQITRNEDGTRWEQRKQFQAAPAPFHMSMNAQWVVCTKHYGSTCQPGSLSYIFHLSGKTRLANDKPDFHTLNAAQGQALDGLILNAWHLEIPTQFKGDLGAFLRSKPAPSSVAHGLAWELAKPA
ncbi:hypothetical protein AAF712_015625 [Marasmius tenuissimus]|uniref:DUF6589 domain-containing protein n=1 Tax=Marasmius tenuissimus TaxID=585030 RepID=A0ABR2Z925_9AGAR